MSELFVPTFQPGQIVLNKYRVEQPLRYGQYGEVYRVTNLTMGGLVSALKLVRVKDPNSHKVVVESQIQSLCGHDHVVTIRTADVLNDALLIEMEFVERGSLGDRLRREFVPVTDNVAYIKGVLFALEHAHHKGFVHRDVKPENIMLSGPLTAKLSDFGTAIQVETGIRVINEFYLPHASPEAANNQEFTFAGDVFGAGMTLLRAVNNMADWGAVLEGTAWMTHVANGTLSKQIGYADYVPQSLKTIINRALCPQPDKRYPTAAAFRQALEGLCPVRSWVRKDEQTWACEAFGKGEVVRYVGGRSHTVEYVVGNRRQRPDCQTFDTERKARACMGKLVAKTTFRNAGKAAARKRAAA